MAHPKGYPLLLAALVGLRSCNECHRFLSDLLSPQELRQISKRFAAAIELQRGSTHRKVARRLSISSTTVSRVNRFLDAGSGGYALAMSRLSEKGKTQATATGPLGPVSKGMSGLG